MDPLFLSRRAASAGYAGKLHAGGGRSGPALSRRGDPARHSGEGARRHPAAARGDRARLSVGRAAQPPILYAADRAGAAAPAVNAAASSRTIAAPFSPIMI